MYNRYNIGNYYLKRSFIHELNPTFKIISLIICIIATFTANNYIDFIVIFGLIIFEMFLSKISFKIYFKNIYSLKIFILFIFIINLIFGLSFISTIYMILKIVYVVLLSAILTFTTPPMEITYGLERVFRIFNKFISVNSIALSITLALRFIPVTVMQAERIIKASSLRGVDYNEI